MRNLSINTDLQYFSSSFQFEENFNILQYSGYRTTSISIYTDYGNLSGEYDIEQDCVIEDSRENRVKIQRHLTTDGWKRVSDVYGTLDELCDDIGDVNYNNIQELYDVLDELRIEYTSNYIRTSTRGYSQGDYAEILINAVEFKKVMGTEFDLDGMKKWFDHYFWDSEIGGEIEVSFDYTNNAVNFRFEEELEFREWTADEYDVDGLEVDRIIEYIKGEVLYPLSDEDVVQLKDALNLDYTDVSYPRCG